jgi:hypothetical protein
MTSRLRARITYANVAATLALVLSMSGGALAAQRYLITSTSQVSPAVLAKIAGAKISKEEKEKLGAIMPYVKYVASGVGGKPTIQFSGANVQIVSGSGSTAGAVNGAGNLIVGYDESPGEQTGSHDIVVGSEHTYTSYGSIVGGQHNSATSNGTVVFGDQNKAGGEYATATAGSKNIALGPYSAVSGGQSNEAVNADHESGSSVSGGSGNVARGLDNSISGGQSNHANGATSSVTGGFGNTTNGPYSSVLGGTTNTAWEAESVVVGGRENQAKGLASAILGGREELLEEAYSHFP